MNTLDELVCTLENVLATSELNQEHLEPETLAIIKHATERIANVHHAKARLDHGITTEVCITWYAEDVLGLYDSLTPEQVGRVLDLVKEEHDTLGANWDTFEAWIEEVKE